MIWEPEYVTQIGGPGTGTFPTSKKLFKIGIYGFTVAMHRLKKDTYLGHRHTSVQRLPIAVFGALGQIFTRITTSFAEYQMFVEPSIFGFTSAFQNS